MLSPNDYLVLSPGCFLKSLEEPCVYNVETDELYETNMEAFDFLKRCDGSRRIRELSFDRAFVDWCLDEKILVTGQQGAKRHFILERDPKPSLRYLEIQVTARCNLQCRHCYLGTAKVQDLTSAQIIAILREFEQMQGLRLLISGGEPLLHPDFWSINDRLTEFGFRSVLLSNGSLIDSAAARQLNAHEVQISLDGIGDSHDFLRGRGSFDKAIRAIHELRSVGKDISVATMVHARNQDDFPKLSRLIEGLGIKEWNVDVPCAAGKLLEHEEVKIPYARAARLLKYSFGGGLYSSSPGYACGAHLCTVTPEGRVAKCGFFADKPVGYIEAGLRSCWERMEHIKLAELKCHCQYIEECRGGCRFRAFLENDIYAPDPVQCYLKGVSPAE